MRIERTVEDSLSSSCFSSSPSNSPSTSDTSVSSSSSSALWEITALRWLVRNCGSNVELAILSNVCRVWRVTVIVILKEEALALALTEERQDTPEEQNEEDIVHGHHCCPVQKLLLPSMMRQQRKLTQQIRQTAEQQPRPLTKGTSEQYCLAWFAPEGIIHQSIICKNSHRRRSKQKRQPSRHPPPPPQPTLVVRQWRGYNHATQVLGPFGYADAFVRDACNGTWNCDCNCNCASNSNNDAALGPEPLQQPLPTWTWAVRGATVAQPDHYNTHNNNDNIKNNNDSDMEDRQPRVLLRSSQGPRRLLPPAVQFLNASGAHAVCMKTPTFPPPPPSSSSSLLLLFDSLNNNSSHPNHHHPKHPPIIVTTTIILLVGIATEDGCFVSGLHRRSLELGHLYPPHEKSRYSSSNDDCSTTSSSTREGGWSAIVLAAATAQSELPSSSLPHDEGKGHHEQEENEEDDEVLCIHQGLTGPGQWRCYTAIYEQKHIESTSSLSLLSSRESTCWLRVNGVPEPMHVRQQRLRRQPKPPQQEPISFIQLDGLTLGSDHGFDMSLCCGHGSSSSSSDDNERQDPNIHRLLPGYQFGTGAIAEVVVFQGHRAQQGLLPVQDTNDHGDNAQFADEDVRALERYLMRKHGISILYCDSNTENDHNHGRNSPRRTTAAAAAPAPAAPAAADTLLQHYNDYHQHELWKRQSHALMLRVPPHRGGKGGKSSHQLNDPPCKGRRRRSQYQPQQQGVPLSIVAQHPAVAWHRMNPVTLQRERIAPIGGGGGGVDEEEDDYMIFEND